MRSRATRAALVAAGLLVFGLAFGNGVSGNESESGESIRVMSFNIRCPSLEDGFDFWWFRKDEVAKYILRHSPDLAGMQEVYPFQARYLEKQLVGYEWFGLPPDVREHLGERCKVFYRKERLELLDHQTFWLSESPETPGSISWDSAHRRVVTWGKFRDRNTGKVFFLFNTHFDHKGGEARKHSARLLVEKVSEIASDYPAIITGDFNCPDDSEPYQTLTSLLADTREVSKTPAAGPYATSRGFEKGSRPKNRSDYIFVTPDIKVLDYAVLDDTYGDDRRPSDHMAVLVTIEAPAD